MTDRLHYRYYKYLIIVFHSTVILNIKQAGFFKSRYIIIVDIRILGLSYFPIRNSTVASTEAVSAGIDKPGVPIPVESLKMSRSMAIEIFLKNEPVKLT